MPRIARKADTLQLPPEAELRRNPAVDLGMLAEAESLLAKLAKLEATEIEREPLAMPGPFDSGPVRLLENWNQRRTRSCDWLT